MKKVPVLDYEPKAPNEPVLVSSPEQLRWTFSLRYWEQIELFGLNKSESKWFVSLLSKLKDLSQKEVDKFISDNSERDAWRYHNINWNQKNIPIQRKSITWLDSQYLNNEEDFPILQFQVSKSLGRVIGFWDEKSVFNILLLDPLHNIQPSKSHSYKVDDCSPLSCDYSSIINEIEKLKLSNLCGHDCGNFKILETLPSRKNRTNVLMHFLDDGEIIDLESTLEGSGYSIYDALMLGLETIKN